MKFFILTNPEIGGALEKVAGIEASFEEGFNTGPAPHCPHCGGCIGLLTWLPPYRVELETKGNTYGDVVFGTGHELLVSLRFRDLYEASGLVGVTKFEPVEVVKVKRRRKSLKGCPPPYFKADVVRSEAALDDKASGSEWEGVPDLCPVCRRPRNKVTFLRRKGTMIEAGTWSGEDIFIPRASADFLVTPRFKEFCEQHDVKNAVFIPAEQHGVDFYPSTAKRMQSILRCWEDKKQSAAARRDAYCTLVFWIYGDRSKRSQGKFDPDREIDPTVIDEARRRIREELESEEP